MPLAELSDQLHEKFQQFTAKPGEASHFYEWRSLVERLLKTPVAQIQEKEGDFIRAFPQLANQLDLVPSQWKAECVSLRMRFDWLMGDLKESATPKLLECLREIETRVPRDKDIYEVTSPEIIKRPVITLSTSMTTGGSQNHFTRDRKLAYSVRLKRCKTEQDYTELSSALVLEFYDMVQEGKPENIRDFITQSAPIYPGVMTRSSNNDLLTVLLDTLPYLLFQGHRSPYNEGYIECAHALTSQLVQLLENNQLSFKKAGSGTMDDVIHYLFHALFFYLEQGRLVAFEDLFDLSIHILHQSPKFNLRHDYLPLLPEMFYWIPHSYRDRIRTNFHDKVEMLVKDDPNSPLSPLLYLRNVDASRALDKRLLMTEFLKEVYKDREVAEEERKIIKTLMGSLEFPISEYRVILREVFREISEDRVREKGDLDRMNLMERLVRLAIFNGTVAPEQRELLLKAAGALGFSVARYHEIEVRCLKHKESIKISGPGLRRLNFKDVSLDLLQSLEFYKWKQLKLEGFERDYRKFLKDLTYSPKKNHILLQGDLKECFTPLRGELKITATEDVSLKNAEVSLMFVSERKQLRKWFEIVNQIEYVVFDHTDNTLSIEIYLVNRMGCLMITRDLPMQNPQKFTDLLQVNHGRCNLFILEERKKSIMHWLPHACYLIDRSKVAPVLDALSSRNLTSIKILSKIGQKKHPDEIIYYHIMMENALFMGSSQKEVEDMIELGHELIKNKFQDDFKLLYYLGYLYFESGNYREGFHWTLECLKRKPDYKEALFLYCERKLAEDVLDPLALGYLKYLDLNFGKEERLQKLYQAIEKKHSLELQPLLSRSRFTIASRMLQE